MNGSKLTELIIPDNITAIKNFAFYGYSGLTSITIPESVTTLGQFSFSGCNGLTEVIIPGNVATIDRYAFSSCFSLCSVIIEEGVTTIKESAFYYCNQLKTIVLPDSIKMIEDSAFRDCRSLTLITIPDSVTAIGEDAFSNCSKLTIEGSKQSYAQTYAQDNGIPFKLFDNQIVSDLIADLPTGTDITVEDADDIIAARDAYDALNDESKSLVINYEKLVAVEYVLSAKLVEALLFSLPATNEVMVENEEDITAARTAYDALDDIQKAMVTNYENLVAAEQALELEKAEAARVETMISVLPTPSDVEVTDQDAIGVVREKYEGLTQGQKALVSNYEKLVSAEDALVVAKAKYVATQMDASILALPTQIVLEYKEQIRLVRSRYNALNSLEKSYVTQLAVLEQAEARLIAIMPTFAISGITTVTGDTFRVAITTKNNIGIVGLRLFVDYNSKALEVVSFESADFKSVFFSPEGNNPAVIHWVESLEGNNTTNGTVAYITFKVKDNAALGKYNLTLRYDPEDVFDFDYNNVEFLTQNAVVNVVEYISGDLNRDGEVDNKDLSVMQRYLCNWDIPTDKKAADVNRDGVVNNKDFSILQRYLNGWDVVLK